MNYLKALLSAALGCAILTGCASQQAPQEFWKNHFVFVSHRNGQSDIHLSDLRGQQTRALTSDVAEDATPRVLSDGRIVFASRRTGTWQIYVMNWDGSEEQMLTHDAGINNYRPAASPDGRIIFVSDRHQKPHIFSMNPDGSDQVQLSHGDHYNDFPVVSEEGQVYFSSSRSTKWEIWRMAPDGSMPTQMTHFPQNIKELAIVPAHVKDFNEYSSNLSPMLPFFNLAIRPRLVFSATTPQGNLGLYRINTDGTDFRELSNHSLYTNRSPVLRPDGLIMFTSDRAGSTDVWSMTPDGRNPRRITHSSAYDSSS